MKFETRDQRNWTLLFTTLSTLLVLLLVSGVFVWSPLNCRHEDVDIHSGRIRRTRFLLYCKVGERIEESWLSRALPADGLPPEWHRVNTFSPSAGHSPHYRYHGATHTIRTLELAQQILPMAPEARRLVAQTVVEEWRRTNSYSSAEQYAVKVAGAAARRREAGASVLTVSDLRDHW